MMVDLIAVLALLGSSVVAGIMHYALRRRLISAAFAAFAAFSVVIVGTIGVMLIFGSLVGLTVALQYVGPSMLTSVACFWAWVSHLVSRS